MKCSNCGKYDALNWSKQRVCLRCWLGSDEPPAANEELELVDNQVIDNSETGPDEVTEESHCYTCGQYLSECLCND